MPNNIYDPVRTIVRRVVSVIPKMTCVSLSFRYSIYLDKIFFFLHLLPSGIDLIICNFSAINDSHQKAHLLQWSVES